MAEQEILTSALFYLELKLDGSKDAVDGIFMDCKGFKSTQEVIEITEVTPNKWGRVKRGQTNEQAQFKNPGQIVRTKIPGNVKVNNITLRRGLIASKTLWLWFEDVQRGNWDQQRRDGSLTIYNQKKEAQARFQFERAWPTNYTLTDLNASSNEYEIEELELVCEAFKRVDT